MRVRLYLRAFYEVHGVIMPGLHERHGKASGWDSWESQPSRSQQVQAAIAEDDPEPVKGKVTPWPGTKCKRNKGQPHEGVVQLRYDYFAVKHGNQECGWRLDWSHDRETGERRIRYDCWHEMVCQHCGKILDWKMNSTTCPLAPEREEERRRVREEAKKSPLPPRHRNRPVITGPQGYRKPRNEKEKS